MFFIWGDGRLFILWTVVTMALYFPCMRLMESRFGKRMSKEEAKKRADCIYSLIILSPVVIGGLVLMLQSLKIA